MKVLHIGQMIGGLDVYIRNSITYASGEIEYVIMHGKDDGSSPVVYQGKAIKEYLTSLQRALSPVKDFTTLIEAVRIIRKEKPDVVHCHSAKGGIVGRLAGWLTGTPTLYTPHGFSFLSSPSKKVQWMYKTIERMTRCNAYLLACGESEHTLGVDKIGYTMKKAFCWHNCVSKNSITDSNAGKCKNNYVSIIGRPSYQKNPLLLVEVVKRVHEKLPDLKFFLLGVGYYSPDLNEMKKRIHDYDLDGMIILVPWISHEECLKRVYESQMYLTVSRYEGLPLAIIEAMSLGKAIVATDVVGNRDCLCNNMNGYLLNESDVDGIADTVVRISTDVELRKRLERGSKKLFGEKFDIEKRIGMLEKIYHSFER